MNTFEVIFCGNGKVSDSNGVCSQHPSLERAKAAADLRARQACGQRDFSGGQYEVWPITGSDENASGPVYTVAVD